MCLNKKCEFTTLIEKECKDKYDSQDFSPKLEYPLRRTREKEIIDRDDKKRALYWGNKLYLTSNED